MTLSELVIPIEKEHANTRSNSSALGSQKILIPHVFSQSLCFCIILGISLPGYRMDNKMFKNSRSNIDTLTTF